MFGSSRFSAGSWHLFVAIAVGWLSGVGSILAQEHIVNQVWIYTDSVPSGEPDNRGQVEKYYDPYYFSPAGKSSDVAVNPDFELKELQPDGRGTCVEIKVNFRGPNEWVQVGWQPQGARVFGEQPGLNIADALAVSPNQKVFLEFKARRRADDHVLASFRMGGLAGRPHKDSLRPSASRRPDGDELTADWQTYRIDLTKRAHELNSVLCPLSITLEINRNPRARPARDPDTGRELDYVQLVVYVDDVRFITVADR